MISIQAIMLVTLGFLVAGFFALLIAPAYRRRAARLANDELKRTMPLSEAEIRADKDRLRADYAIYIRQLQDKVDTASDATARQLIELNRRDAAISSLEGEVGELRTSLEEHQNARRVLEQTIMDRLPKVEQRLQSAKHLLQQRDQEVARLTETADRQVRALAEAEQINRQLRDETQRLEATLKTRSVRNRDSASDARFDGEVALRSEIEALRTKSRDQASLIARLKAGTAKAGESVPEGETKGDDAVDEIARLSSDLAAAEAALRAAQSESSSDRADQSKRDDELRRIKSKTQDQAAKIAELEAALKSYKSAETDNKVLAESKMALKAHAMSLEAQSQKHIETIASLRAEVATANERLARQAKHFMDEMRRLGSGTVPVSESSTSSRSKKPDRQSGTDLHVDIADAEMRQSLTDRINEPRIPAKSVDRTFAERLGTSGSSSKGDVSSVSGKKVRPAEGSADAANDESKAKPSGDGKGKTGVVSKSSENNGKDQASPTSPAVARKGKSKKPGLMERITRLDKTKQSSKSA